MGSEGNRSFSEFWRRIDYLQIAALLALLGIGLVFIRSTGLQVDTPESRSFFFRQLRWIGTGMVFYLFFALTDYRRLSFRFGSLLLYSCTVGLLIAVLFFGVRIYGAIRWINIFGFRLQPSEPAKLAVIAMLAGLFSSRWFRDHPGASLLWMAAIAGIPFFLIAREPDLGSAVILLPIAFTMLFLAGLKWRCVLFLLLFVIVSLALLTADALREKPLILRTYQRDRIRIFLNPGLDRRNRGHNAYQAMLAVGSGGLSGKGIGQGTQNELGFLPQTVANNDFIFSVIAEETGFSGGIALLTAYAILLYTMLRTAFTSPPYGRFLAAGGAMLIFLHVFINVGMSIGLAPVTGLPLPLVSYGGSFMLCMMSLLGVLQSIHRHRQEF